VYEAVVVPSLLGRVCELWVVVGRIVSKSRAKAAEQAPLYENDKAPRCRGALSIHPVFDSAQRSSQKQKA
jgi:hypothetical protein